MANIFKIKKYWVVTLMMMFFSMVSFAQDYTDQTIGFEIIRTTASLKRHGVKEENLQREIALIRKLRQKEYIKIKADEDLLSDKIKSEQSSKKIASRSSAISLETLTDIPSSERAALVAFYNSTNGQNWSLLPNMGRAWEVNNPTSDVSGWYGVTVENGHVVALNLFRSRLSGIIPDEIRQLTQLKNLKITNNSITGEIPSGLCTLTNLETLELFGNYIQGSIPQQIGQLTNLTVLHLGSNQLTGPIPVEIGSLINLKLLNLAGNRLSSTIPHEIGLLTALEDLNLAGNYNLTGDIPLELYQLTNIKILYLSTNKLTGGISPQINRLTQVKDLRFDDNNLTGIIPNEIYELDNLEYLYLGRNYLAGTIPSQISNLTRLAGLSLGVNQLTGPLPLEIGQLNLLEYLYLENNNLTGNVPSVLTNLPNLNTLVLNSNQFTGIIPDFTNSPSLQVLAFAGNNFRYVDFSNQFETYTTKLYFLDFRPQNKIDSEKTITGSTGGSIVLTMYEDDRFTSEETFQWYKGISPNGVLIEGANSRSYTITNLTASNEGDYYCVSKHPEISLKLDAWNLNLTLERKPIHVAVTNCAPINMILKASQESPMQNANTIFSLETTATNLTYNWKFYNPDNTLKDTQTSETVTQSFPIPGVNKAILEVADATGCIRKFEKTINVIDPCSLTAEERIGIISIPGTYGSGAAFVNLNETINPELYLYNQNSSKTYSYKWSLFNQNSELINSGNQSAFPIILTSEGFYKIELEITDSTDGCKTKYTKAIGSLIQNSCTNENPKSTIVHDLLMNLIKKLISRSILGETDEQINLNSASIELDSLKPYITNIVGNKIYNFATTHNQYNQITSVDFSFSPNREYDIHISTPYGIYYYEEGTTEDLYSNIEYSVYIDLSQYTSSSNFLISCYSSNGDRSANRLTSVLEPTDCARETEIRYIDFCPAEEEITCVNQPINLSFETTSTNINYNWYTVKTGSSEHLYPITNTTGLYTFTPVTAGTYTVFLNAYEENECTFEFSKIVKVDSCVPFVSCTKDNPNTPKIKAIFTTLANKLASLPAETIIDGYKCDELKALAFYIKDENPAIYNFVHDTQQGFIAFSFADHTDYDVKIATNGNVIADFNLDQYESNTIVTELRTDSNDHFENFVNHIDFCSELYCISHIAFVVDESGSIAPAEAAKIKKQLKKYIQQQAYDNDKLKSEVYVSLIGMSDSDANTRTDNVPAIRVTNEDPAVLTRFNNWIDKYGTRNGTPGVSASSDYWKSGLDVALNSTMKPNIVMMITDGCETSNVEQLKETMSQFNNSKNPLDNGTDKPHLYVIGIENGFYVDGGLGTTSLARNEDPNYVQTLSADGGESRVVAHLTTSLKYLLSYPETDFPVASIDNFGGADYFGYENFDSLGTMENETYFSDKLKLSHFACGDPADKNYCSDCLSFQPIPEKEYMLSAWVKEESLVQVKTYENAVINVIFYSDVIAEDLYRISTEKLTASGDIIDGWQRITANFLIPKGTKTIGIELENKSSGIPAYFDDIRIHPLDGSVKTFVYDSETFKLMSELDENNYSTFYEYDNEGGLVRIKKETAKGVKTIQETRSGNIINN
jgi:Leucine-rich repeat (LRR) protein